MFGTLNSDETGDDISASDEEIVLVDSKRCGRDERGRFCSVSGPNCWNLDHNISKFVHLSSNPAFLSALTAQYSICLHQMVVHAFSEYYFYSVN